MKKIKNIQQLQAEKKRIKQQQQELEKNIRQHWEALKISLRPASVAGDILNSVLQKKADNLLPGDGILQNTFTYGLMMLAQRLGEKAGEKFQKMFKRK